MRPALRTRPRPAPPRLGTTHMPDPRHFNLIVIGTGPGGYVAAIRAAQLGLKTAVVEKDELGGTCLNWGCIPTKAWIVSAHLLEQIRRAREFGIDVGEPRVDWALMLERKNKVVKQVVGGVKTLLSGRGDEIVRGAGRLTAPGKVQVALKEGGSTALSADHVLIATGATSWLPPGFKLDGERVITSQEALDLPRQPRRMAVLGGGVVGCEFACFFAALGTEVTLIEMLPRLVPAEDDEIAQTLEREMKKQKITIHLGTRVDDLKQNGDGSTTLTIAGGAPVTVDTVLVATGRRPYSSDLGLEALGVARGDRGKVVVNDRLQTSVRGIWAIGDVTDIKQLAH